MRWPYGRRVLRPRVYPAAAGTWRAAPGGLVKLRAPGVTPIEAYRGRAQVPIGIDGQVSAPVPSASVSGSVASPTVFDVFATLVIPPGPVTVAWTVTLGGTVGAGDANNFAVRVQSGPTLAISVNAGAGGTYPQAAITVTGPTVLQLESWSSTPTAGSVYSGTMSISAAQVSLQAGPSGIGARWALDQAGIATSVGQADVSTCAVYAGPQASAPYLVAQSYAGGGDAIGLAGYELQPGEFVFAVWTGGTPGSVAQLKVAGQKTVLVA